MAKKIGMTTPKDESGGSLTGILIGMVAAGFAASAILIGSAKRFGEKLEELEVEKYKRLERQREADKEDVLRIMNAEAVDNEGLLEKTEVFEEEQ
ncbi:MAG: hypothetical protein IJH57_00080 [Mogibacterium sp.]|nr:hypothetical protein [Mogibacterium sp.]